MRVTCLQVRLHDVVHIDEVTGLFPSPKIVTPSPPQHLEDEDGDHVAVLIEALMRAVDVEIAQRDRFEIIELP